MHCSGKKIHSFYSLKKWKDLTFYCWIEIAYLVMIFAFSLTDVLFPWSHETLTEHKGFVCVSVCSMYYLLNTWEHGALKRGAMGAISLPLRCQGGNFHHLGQIRRGFLEPRKWHQVTNNKCNIQAELKPMKSQWAPYPSIGKKQRRKHSVDGEASWANWLSWECAQGAVEGVLSWMASWGTGPLYITR